MTIIQAGKPHPEHTPPVVSPIIATVEFNLFCNKENGQEPWYRIWCNDTLMTERTFRWDTYDRYLSERLILEVEPDSDNEIVIDNLSDFGEFKVDDVEIEFSQDGVTANFNITA